LIKATSWRPTPRRAVSGSRHRNGRRRWVVAFLSLRGDAHDPGHRPHGQQNRQYGGRDDHVPTRPAEETGVGRDRARPDIAQGIDTGAIRPGVSSDGDAQDI
jgi:hypothetical protein